MSEALLPDAADPLTGFIRIRLEDHPDQAITAKWDRQNRCFEIEAEFDEDGQRRRGCFQFRITNQMKLVQFALLVSGRLSLLLMEAARDLATDQVR